MPRGTPPQPPTPQPHESGYGSPLDITLVSASARSTAGPSFRDSLSTAGWPACLTVAGTLAIWALAPLVVLAIVAANEGGSFTGSDSFAIADQFQYLWWVRDAGHHLLVSNGYDGGASSHVFLHPMFLVSGLLWRAGLSVQLSYLVWTPVATGLMLYAYVRYAQRFLGRGSLPAVTAMLALFLSAPAALVAGHAHLLGSTQTQSLTSAAGAFFPAGRLWGYLPWAFALGLMPLFLLGLEGAQRSHAEGVVARRRVSSTAVIGLAAAWMHPWEGETLLLITAALMLWAPRRRQLLVPALGTAAPLVYYEVLARTDPAWRIAQSQNRSGHIALWALLAVTLPLLLLLPAGLRGAKVDIQERALRVWPLAALAVYLFTPTVPAHALTSMSLPLAILATRGWQHLRWPSRVAAAGVAALTLVAMLNTALVLRDAVRSRSQPYILSADESRAMRYLRDSPITGGVLSSAYLAAVVPVFSGRHTWVGHPSWTPDFFQRAQQAQDLFSGAMSPPAAQLLVRRSDVGFLLSDCKSRSDLRDLRGVLGPLLIATRRFGCATVYQVKTRR